MITLRQNPNEPSLYIGSERGGGKLPAFAPESSPRLMATTPADNSGAISTTPLIRLTFDTPVALGSGSFFISDGTTQSYLDPGSGMPATRIIGATHTLQLAAGSAVLGGGGYYVEFTPPSPLKGGTAYFVLFKPGAIVSAGNGLPYAGLADATMLNFVTSSDTTAPSALSARTTNPAGTYNAGDVITITVDFSETVTVSGAPRLELNLGANRFATLAGPSSGTSLSFAYTVQAGDTAAELAFVDLKDLASGIADSNGNPLTLGNIAFTALDAAASTGSGSDLAIDTTAPTANAWNVTKGATDVPHGSTLSLTFSENIVVTDAGSRVFVGLDGGIPVGLPFTDPSISISGNTLFMSGLAANTSYQVSLSAGALSDLGGNPILGAPQTFFATSATSPALDTIAPGVLDVSAPVGLAATEYNVGQVVSLQVTMSENVNVTGLPVLRLQLANGTADATYAGSTGKVLSFNYTVAAGDNAASLATAGSGALILADGASITDIKGNPAVLALPAPGTANALDANTNIEIDTDPLVTFTAPASGSGAVALTNNLLINFSEALTLAGTNANFRLYRDDAGVAVELPVVATVTGAVLTIDPVADMTANQNYFVQIDGNALVDSDGNLFSGYQGTTAYTFNTNADTTQPAASAARTTNAAGAYKAGDTITIEVSFSETVTGTGTPRLELNLGSARFATHAGPTTGSVLTFTYVVQAGDTASELAFVDTGDLVGGIADLGGNTLDQAHILFGALDAANGGGYGSDIVIDTAAPAAQGWTLAGGATDYDHLTTTATLTFSEAIFAAGPASKFILGLNDGAGTQEILFSDPRVTIGDSAISINGFSQNTSYLVSLSNGSLVDAAGNTYSGFPQLSFATAAVPASADSIPPKILSVSASSGSAAVEYTAGNVISVQVHTSEMVTVSGGVPSIRLQLDNGSVEATLAANSGKILTFTYTVLPGDNAGSLAYVDINSLLLNGATIADTNGNSAVLTLPAPGTPGSLDDNTNISIDTAPVALSFNPGDNAGAVAVGSNLTITFSENIALAGAATSFRLYQDTGAGVIELGVTAFASGKVLTLDPQSDFVANANYYIEIDNGAVTDADGNAFAGITGNSGYNFSTSLA